MNDSLSVVIKILIASAGLAIAIKYGLPYFNIPATATVALISVLLPTGVMAMILAWKTWRSQMG